MNKHKSSSDWSRSELIKEQKAEREFRIKKKKELLKAEERRRNKELLDIRLQGTFLEDRIKKMTTSKLLMYFILINCTVVEVYSMVVMYLLADLSALYSLIGAVVTESISYAIYCAKSYQSKREEVASKLARDKFEASLYQAQTELVPDPIPEDDDHSGDIPKGTENYEDLAN